MKIDSILAGGQALSFEVFPPKPELDEDLSGIRRTLSDLTVAEPDFVSVTYGAGGNNRPRALDIAEMILALDMVPLSHLTAVGYTKEDTTRVLSALASRGVKNILALRGDIPVGAPEDVDHWKDFACARDLAVYVNAHDAGGKFCIGGAAYPEGHPQSVSHEVDVDFIKEKVEAGVSFFITQLFFEDETFLRFVDRLRASGVTAPVIAGIMPVFQAKQIKRIVEISGCSVPQKLALLLDRYENDNEAMAEAGADYAAAQIRNLWDRGASGIHVYTMNKAARVLDILKRCGMSTKAERSAAR